MTLSLAVATQDMNVMDRQTPSHRTAAKAVVMRSIAQQTL